MYVGHHTHSWGGWCYHTGNHRHYYAPARGHHYRHDGGVYYYSGTYDSYYHQDKHHYGRDGRDNRRGTTTTAYSEHKNYRDTVNSGRGGGLVGREVRATVDTRTAPARAAKLACAASVHGDRRNDLG